MSEDTDTKDVLDQYKSDRAVERAWRDESIAYERSRRIRDAELDEIRKQEMLDSIRHRAAYEELFKVQHDLYRELIAVLGKR